LNSNTSTRHHPRRSGRRSGGRPHHVAKHHAPRQSQAPALEAIDCDTSPVAFTSLGLDSRLLEGIRDLGFQETRPIQSAVIPLALGGHDLIACAETGTGKTAAFVVPTLQRLLIADLKVGTTPGSTAVGTAPDSTGVGTTPDTTAVRSATDESQTVVPRSRVLVLAPTRELAVQIEDEIHGLSYHTTVTSAAIYGGVEMGGQERALKAGVDIIVATPGRLIDHMRQQNADLSGISLLVLDEADRMMDMGFWPDVRKIIGALPSVRQTLLFSATMPDDVVRFALEIVREPKFVQVGHRSKPAKSISHRAEVVDEGAKLEWLIAYLRRSEGPVLVFTRMKVGADRLSRKLAAAGLKVAALHADRSQDQRRVAVEGFRGGRYKVLVATDIAARGLDIDGIHTVINYELPDSPESYVHRVGRTGRADEVGQAITLVSPAERHAWAHMEKSVGVRID
jgi:ATP-dependent RNA helicase RhlE